jgi:mono/diheme cytochrome c family protein
MGKSRLIQRWGLVVVLSLGFLPSCTWDHVQPDVCFESEVLPVFVTYCTTSGCHNSVDRVEDYDLTNYNGIMEGIRPKNVAGSKLLESMSGFGEEKMPPSGYPQPSADQIATLKAWVKSGAANTTNCSVVTCDSAAVVTYAGDIEPMLQTYCIGCHSAYGASGGVDLSNFNTVKQYGQNGKLAGTISGDPNFKVMPPNGTLLSSCYVTKVQQWVAAGALQN